MTMSDDHTFNIMVRPMNSDGTQMDRWEVPSSLLGYRSHHNTAMLLQWGGAKFTNKSEPFSFSLSDPQTDELWVTTKDRSLICMDKFLQMGFLIKSHKVWGIGERVRGFDFPPEEANFTGWNRG